MERLLVMQELICRWLTVDFVRAHAAQKTVNEALVVPINQLLKQLGTRRRIHSQEALCATLETSQILLAWGDGSIVGMLVVTLGVRLGGQHQMYLDDFIVSSEFRRRGIGRQMISEVLTQMGLDRLFLCTHETNNVSRRFYMSLGFKQEAYVPFWYYVTA